MLLTALIFLPAHVWCAGFPLTIWINVVEGLGNVSGGWEIVEMEYDESLQDKINANEVPTEIAQSLDAVHDLKGMIMDEDMLIEMQRGKTSHSKLITV